MLPLYMYSQELLVLIDNFLFVLYANFQGESIFFNEIVSIASKNLRLRRNFAFLVIAEIIQGCRFSLLHSVSPQIIKGAIASIMVTNAY